MRSIRKRDRKGKQVQNEAQQTPKPAERSIRKRDRKGKVVEKEAQHTPKPAEVGRISKENFRSNLYSCIHFINNLPLSDDHLQLLKDFSPFWKLISNTVEKKLETKSCRKSDDDICSIISTYDKKKKGFKFGDQYKFFTKNDVERIFGIEGGREAVVNAEKPLDTSLFLKRCFPDPKKNFAKGTIKKSLTQVVEGVRDIDLEDVVRLTTLLFLASVFLPSKGGSISWSYVEFVTSLEKIKTYDWAAHIAERLTSSIHTHHNRPKNVTGCVVALPYWLLETFELTDVKDANADMWCTKWCLAELAKHTKTKSIIDLCLEKASTAATVTPNIQSSSLQSLYKTPSGDELLNNQQQQQTTTTENMQASKDANTMLDDLPDDDSTIGASVSKRTVNIFNRWQYKFKQLEKVVKEKNERIGELEKQLLARDDEITSLKKKLSEIENGGDVLESLSEDVGGEMKESDIGELETQKEREELEVEEKYVQGEDFGDEEMVVKENDMHGEDMRHVAEVISIEETEEQHVEQREESNVHLEAVNSGQGVGIFDLTTLSTQEADILDSCIHKITQEATQFPGVSTDEMVRLAEAVSQEMKVSQTKTATNTQLTAVRELSSDDMFVKYAEDMNQKLTKIFKQHNVGSIEKNVRLAEVSTDEMVRLAEAVSQEMKVGQTKTAANTQLTAVREFSSDDMFVKYAEEMSQKLRQKKEKTNEEIAVPEAKKETKIFKQHNVGSIEKNVKVRQGRKSNRRRTFAYETVGKKIETPETPVSRPSFILLDEDTPLPKIKHKKGKQKTPVLGPNSPVVPFLADEEYELIRHIHLTRGLCEVVWRKTPGTLRDGYATLEDVYTIMERTRLSNNVIDAHAESLRRRFNPNDGYAFYIFDSLCCAYISYGDKYEAIRTARIDNILKAHVAKPWHKLIFPIVAEDHWTLLVLDNLRLEWFFYNSLKPRTKKTEDPYEVDARVVKAYVEQKLKHFIMESVKNGDPYNYGYMHRDGMCHTGLSQDDCDWEWHAYSKDEISQQESGSLDCGVYVCYWMSSIVKGDPIPARISKHDFGFFKGNLVGELIA